MFREIHFFSSVMAVNTNPEIETAHTRSSSCVLANGIIGMVERADIFLLLSSLIEAETVAG